MALLVHYELGMLLMGETKSPASSEDTPRLSRGQVTCLATDFYPRHLNLTLLRDGQPVPDHQITGGELLPNADETYQMRKSLEVSAEELQQHHYTCTAEHLSLDNKLDTNLELGPGVSAVPVVTPVVVLGVALLCVIGVIFISRRKHRTKDYVLAQSSHSLLMFATFIIGETPFPEFSAVVMLDDMQLGYYDSNMKTAILRVPKWTEDAPIQRDASVVCENTIRAMKYRAYYLKQKFNHTGGVHVQQRITGCELLDSDQHGPIAVKDAFNGQSGDQLSFTNDQHSFWSQWHLPGIWDGLQFIEVKWVLENVFHPICMRNLRTYLHKHKNRIMRKVKPRVRLLQKTLPDSGGAKVTCLATGFYPRHMNLTLLRDGQPVPDHQITGGELLPNADETYQMRKSLEVSAEELQQHQYTCTAEHLSLDNKLDIDLVKPRVRLLQQALKAAGGAKVTCLATGFYPRHMNLTLLRDGQPVPDHQITGGELLPNADETYQMRKSLEVSAEELQQHHYTCTAEHLSLDNKLDIDFDAGSDHVPVISSLLVVAGLGLFGATIAGLIICKKTRTGQGSYSSPHIATSDQIETSLDTVS
ncbi:hypothetical protein ACEWY4_011973 [Coilia grayii]|uniref:Ig-like domain-containing protein n=1 Tax=Coilia grayii TaxID=363190 RepID=A0ABD1JZA7_9TELE